jgi:hypothetical protein
MPDPVRSTATKGVTLLIARSQTNRDPLSHLEGEQHMPDQRFLGKLTTDDQGWPRIKFVPKDEPLETVTAFLQDDVDILLPCCDELLQGMHSVLEGKENEWLWSGNRFLLQVGKDQTRVMDKIAQAINKKPPVTIETTLLLWLLEVWRDFVSGLPQQQEFATSRTG